MRTALAVGRLDFWNLTNGRRTDELTPYEEQVWRVYELIEPWGERRADMRMAVQTLSLLQAQSTKTFSQDTREEILSGLTSYLKVDSDESKDVTPDEAARQGKAAFAAIGK